jgi:hypothetical protein
LKDIELIVTGRGSKDSLEFEERSHTYMVFNNLECNSKVLAEGRLGDIKPNAAFSLSAISPVVAEQANLVEFG